MLDPRMPYQYSRNPHSRPRSSVNIGDLYARVSDCPVTDLDVMLRKSRLEFKMRDHKPIFVHTSLIEIYKN